MNADDTIRVSRALQDDAKEIIECLWEGVQVHKEIRALCRALIAATPQCVCEPGSPCKLHGTPQEPQSRFTSDVRSLLQEIAAHGGVTLPLFLARRLNDVLLTEAEATESGERRG